MIGNFTEYGRVTFRKKRVLVGVEKDEEGKEYNQAYYLNDDGTLEKINRKTEEGKILTRIFFLGLESIDLEDAKKEYDEIMSESKERIENINIADYMPKVDKEQYKSIYDMLLRLQETFPYVTSENLKLRLPNLIVEDTSSKDILIDAFYRPKKNYFGMVTENISSEEGKSFAIHELSHMLSARSKKNSEGKIIYTENVGFGDQYHNGIAITEGFNEMFSSLARCAEPRSYETEVGLATFLFVVNKNSYDLTKRFYEGNRYYITTFGRDDESAKRFVKNLDYHNQMYYYNMSLSASVIKETEKSILKKYEKINLLNGRTTKLTEEEKDFIHQMIVEKFDEDFEYDFTDSNFLPNAQDALLDLYDDFMHESNNETFKEIATETVLTSFAFSYNMTETAKKYISEKELEKNDLKFIEIQHQLGLSDEEIANMILTFEANCSSYESNENAIFDDEKLKVESEKAKERYKHNRSKLENEKQEAIITENLETNNEDLKDDQEDLDE